jgi:hypothetical protein
LTRLLGQVDERRNPRTKATVNQLLDRYLEVLDVDQSTRTAYEGYIERHIRPMVGDLQAGRVDVEALDSFYAQLRRCRRRCRRGGRRLIDHRTEREHECDQRCRPHVCRPLAASTLRQIHWILSGAFDRAVRWGHLTVTQIEPLDFHVPTAIFHLRQYVITTHRPRAEPVATAAAPVAKASRSAPSSSRFVARAGRRSLGARPCRRMGAASTTPTRRLCRHEPGAAVSVHRPGSGPPQPTKDR